MTTKRPGKVLTRALLLLLLGLAASVFASLATYAYTGEEAAPLAAPVVRLLSATQGGAEG